jgi:transposase
LLRHRLTDREWELIQDCFPPRARTGRPPRDRRPIVDAIFWILRTGAPWRDLPVAFGPWSTAWDLFDKWNGDGTLDSILSRLRSSQIDSGEVDEELWCIDGTSVRAARCAGGGAKKKIRPNRRTMRWDGPAAGFPRNSTCSAMVMVTRSTST